MKITKNILKNKSKQQLISIALDLDYRRKYGWRSYYQTVKSSLENDLELKNKINELILEKENQTDNNEIPTFFLNQFKELMNEHKHTYNCAICMEDMTADNIAIIVECGHKFHKSCIDKWSEINKKCPHCKCKFSRAV